MIQSYGPALQEWQLMTRPHHHCPPKCTHPQNSLPAHCEWQEGLFGRKLCLQRNVLSANETACLVHWFHSLICSSHRMSFWESDTATLRYILRYCIIHFVLIYNYSCITMLSFACKVHTSFAQLIYPRNVHIIAHAHAFVYVVSTQTSQHQRFRYHSSYTIWLSGDSHLVRPVTEYQYPEVSRGMKAMKRLSGQKDSHTDKSHVDGVVESFGFASEMIA